MNENEHALLDYYALTFPMPISFYIQAYQTSPTGIDRIGCGLSLARIIYSYIAWVMLVEKLTLTKHDDLRFEKDVIEFFEDFTRQNLGTIFWKINELNSDTEKLVKNSGVKRFFRNDTPINKKHDYHKAWCDTFKEVSTIRNWLSHDVHILDDDLDEEYKVSDRIHQVILQLLEMVQWLQNYYLGKFEVKQITVPADSILARWTCFHGQMIDCIESIAIDINSATTENPFPDRVIGLFDVSQFKNNRNLHDRADRFKLPFLIMSPLFRDFDDKIWWTKEFVLANAKQSIACFKHVDPADQGMELKLQELFIPDKKLSAIDSKEFIYDAKGIAKYHLLSKLELDCRNIFKLAQRSLPIQHFFKEQYIAIGSQDSEYFNSEDYPITTQIVISEVQSDLNLENKELVKFIKKSFETVNPIKRKIFLDEHKLLLKLANTNSRIPFIKVIAIANGNVLSNFTPYVITSMYQKEDTLCEFIKKNMQNKEDWSKVRITVNEMFSELIEILWSIHKRLHEFEINYVCHKNNKEQAIYCIPYFLREMDPIKYQDSLNNTQPNEEETDNRKEYTNIVAHFLQKVLVVTDQITKKKRILFSDLGLSDAVKKECDYLQIENIIKDVEYNKFKFFMSEIRGLIYGVNELHKGLLDDYIQILEQLPPIERLTEAELQDSFMKRLIEVGEQLGSERVITVDSETFKFTKVKVHNKSVWLMKTPRRAHNQSTEEILELANRLSYRLDRKPNYVFEDDGKLVQKEITSGVRLPDLAEVSALDNHLESTIELCNRFYEASDPSQYEASIIETELIKHKNYAVEVFIPNTVNNKGVFPLRECSNSLSFRFIFDA